MAQIDHSENTGTGSALFSIQMLVISSIISHGKKSYLEFTKRGLCIQQKTIWMLSTTKPTFLSETNVEGISSRRVDFFV